MSAIAANIHHMVELLDNEEILHAIDTLLRAYVPVRNINEELTLEEQQQLKEARSGVYESL
jgi:hypothetical protein